MKEDYLGWLEENTKLSETSCEKYVRAVKQISEEMLREKLIRTTLYNITNCFVYEVLMNRIMLNEEFIKKNTKGNRMYSRGLEYYLEFLQFRQADPYNDIADYLIFYSNGKGFTYNRDLFTNLYLSLKSKPFVILAGISGTGKSQLARLYAKAIGAEFKLVSVRPDWSDSSDLFGYVNLQGNFHPGCLTEFIRQANDNLTKPFIICLDEMNLARVEHYFSNVLSIMETRRFESGKIMSDSFMDETMLGNDKEKFKDYSSLYFSENLYIIGTVNMDETTFSFSKKVLDRANVIELSEIDLGMGLEDKSVEEIEPVSIENKYFMSEYDGIQKCYADNKKAVDDVIEILTEANDLLKRNNAQVAYRVRNEICYYIAYALQYNLFGFDQAMDNCFMQKVLPRIQGTGEELAELLVGLFNVCLTDTIDPVVFKKESSLDEIKRILREGSQENAGAVRFPNSAKKIAYMLKKCEGDYSYATYWS